MIDYDTLLNEHDDIDTVPYWAEFLGIEIRNWPRERLVKLYLHNHHSTRVVINELQERLGDKDATIFAQRKLIKELEDKNTKEKLAKKFYRDQENKARQRIQELEEKLENNQNKTLN